MAERSFRARVLAREPLLGCFLTWPTEGVARAARARPASISPSSTPSTATSTPSRSSGWCARPTARRCRRSSASRTAWRPPTRAGRSTPAPPASSSRARTASRPCAPPSSRVKYAPVGKRGLAGVRANRYGTIPFDHWVARGQRGDRRSSSRSRRRARSNAVDPRSPPRRASTCSSSGPNDLSQALGVPGHYDDPRYRAAVERVGAVAREHGKGAGIMLRARRRDSGARRARLPRLHDERPVALLAVGARLARGAARGS